jgi:hypothetical protein
MILVVMSMVDAIAYGKLGEYINQYLKAKQILSMAYNH